ncbi:WD40 repeat-like protein [Suillus decipiens]|nr:WD40 repeat-like protein [Suillus decipiens]
MASASTKAVTTQLILKPVTTFKGHGDDINSISYFPDGQRIISASDDKTTRQWDLKKGKEIEDARVVFENWVRAVVVSRDGRWIVTGGGHYDRAELKVCEVEIGNVKIFKGHAGRINCIDISSDSTLLASGSHDQTARIWKLKTGKLVAGPFKNIGYVGAVRFSKDSKKLAVKSGWGKSLEVWDIQSQKLDVSIGKHDHIGALIAPVFWTNNNKTIIAGFGFDSDEAKTIYEFDASTLETVGVPFEGHIKVVRGLALSLDGTLLASTSADSTIKLWAFESRQLLASFDIRTTFPLFLSPDSRQLIYATYDHNHNHNDLEICICDTPPDILTEARIIARKKSARRNLPNSNATRHPPAGLRKPQIYPIPIAPRPPPARDPQQPAFLRLSKFLRFSSRANAVDPVRNNQPRDPLDFPATLPLPSDRPPAECSPSTSLPSGRAFFGKGKQKARGPKRESVKVVDVPLGQATPGDEVGVDDGVRPYVVFFCLSWFQKKEKKPARRPVYDDDSESDEEEENVVQPVVVSPWVQHEEIELKPVVNQSRPETGPSLLAATNYSEVESS